MHRDWLSLSEETRRDIAKLALSTLLRSIAEQANLFAGAIEINHPDWLTPENAVRAFAVCLRKLAEADPKFMIFDAENELLDHLSDPDPFEWRNLPSAGQA